MIRTAIFTYLTCFIALRVVIFYQTRDTCAGDSRPTLLDLKQCQHYSDRYDQECIALEGTVVYSGHLVWDLFNIGSFTLQTTDGRTCTVFTRAAVPAAGRRLLITGTFRQYYKGAYFTWTALVEAERVYIDKLEPDSKPPQQDDLPAVDTDDGLEQLET